KLKVPSAVICDRNGQVYVADYMNDRIQMFDPAGKLLRSISVEKPAAIALHPGTNELYVFSWLLKCRFLDGAGKRIFKATLTRLGPIDDPKPIARYPLPLKRYRETVGSWDGQGGTQYRAELDPWTDPPTIWLVDGGIRLYAVEKDKLVLKRDFDAEAKRAVVHLRRAPSNRQRLYVNPVTGRLYVGEGMIPDGTGRNKAFDQILEIDPDSGGIKIVPLPFNAEEMCFGPRGLVYLRSRSFVARYDPGSWREVPWDYGEHHKSLGFASGRGRRAEVTSALPVFEGINWHMGGMGVSPRGHLAVSCYGVDSLQTRKDEKRVFEGKPYQPRVYPGRVLGKKRALVHVWDRRGRLVHEDAAPGLGDCYGLEIDRDDGLYVLSSGTRMRGPKRWFNDLSGTLIKFRPGKGRIVSASDKAPIVLPKSQHPKRPPDVTSAIQGTAWVSGAQWMYGGVGYFGKNRGVGCACFNTRFCLDYFARSFVPEMDRYSVA
ncbi:hypothetical protein LCGC14_2533890, partial [marine sediment metagenome]